MILDLTFLKALSQVFSATLKALTNATLICAALIFATLIFAYFVHTRKN